MDRFYRLLLKHEAQHTFRREQVRNRRTIGHRRDRQAANIGEDARIGAGSVVVTDVPPYSTVVGVPGHPVRVEGVRPEGPDADWAHLPDPVADAIRALSARVAELEEALAEATGKKPEPSAEVRPLRNVKGSDPAGG